MMMVIYLQGQHISYEGRYNVLFEVNSLRDISTMSYMAHTL